MYIYATPIQILAGNEAQSFRLSQSLWIFDTLVKYHSINFHIVYVFT